LLEYYKGLISVLNKIEIHKTMDQDRRKSSISDLSVLKDLSISKKDFETPIPVLTKKLDSPWGDMPWEPWMDDFNVISST
jgi:hypothetical protein